ncbi:MAG: hypothetical protein WCD08_13490, partial [Steroidobacteraceae bacterium]
MALAAINEPVSAPAMLDNSSRMTGFCEELRRCAYDTLGIAKRVGVHPRLGVNFWSALRPDWTPRNKDPVDTLLELFIDGRSVLIDRLVTHVSSTFVDAA